MADKISEYFNQDKLYDYVKQFSFPRLCGTEGEKEAVDLVIRNFKEIGFAKDQINSQHFIFSDFLSTSLIQFIAMLNMLFVLTNALFLYLYVPIRLITFGVITFFSLFIAHAINKKCKPGFWGEYFGEEREGTNVFTKVLATTNNENDKIGDIILSAHLDSKSQTFKTYWRIIFYNVWLISAIFIGILYVLNILESLRVIQRIETIVQLGVMRIPSTFLLIWIFSFIIILMNMLIMLNYTGNESPGALDNATGMAIVFELSNYFKKQPLQNFNLWFCQFSAEELGTMGSRFFNKEYASQFSPHRTFQINFDVVSCKEINKNRLEYIRSYGFMPRKKKTKILNKYVRNASQEEDIYIKSIFGTIGAHTDSLPFRQRDFEAIDIITTRGTKFCHTKEDNPDKADPEILRQACLLIKKTLVDIDGDYEVLLKKEIIK